MSKIDLEEIDEEEFLEIMCKETYLLLEDLGSKIDKMILSRYSGVNKKDIKSNKLSVGDKFILRRLAKEYVSNYINDGRKLYRHNAKCSSIRIIPEWIKYS